MKNWFEFLNNPKIAIIIIFVFILAMFLGQGLTTGFEKNFTKFGPTKDDDGEPARFMGVKLDSWTMVSVAYVLIFMSTIIRTYYGNVMGENLHSYIWNRAITEVPFSKFWTYLIFLLDPFIQIILSIIDFYALATFQIQYLIPRFIASYITDTPFVIKILKTKTFTS